MGEVWQATSPRDERAVALKVLLDKAARKPDLVARFEREARITERLKSPYVCELLRARRAQSGELYMVLELLHGESLGDRLKREGDMAFADLVPLVDNILEGLRAAHAVGVVHRDLKPGNIFLDRRDGRERAVILDFGISKLLPRGRGGDEGSLTAFDATLGSFAYMAPEQVRGAARADERADLYAAGAVAFRCLAGRLPFEGTNATAMLSAKLSTEPPSLAEATGDRWPASLEAYLAKMMARRREDRFASVAEALEAWRGLVASYQRAFAAGQALSQELDVGADSTRRPGQ
jgi:serine/threonine-protein kinase